jgi:hypothetical protein
MSHLYGGAGGVRETSVVETVERVSEWRISICKTHSVMSLPQSPHKPPICTPCLQGSVTMSTGFSLARQWEISSPCLISQALTLPSVAESQVPNLVSGFEPIFGET